MFRSSSSNWTAIRVISSSSSVSLGCRTTSASKPTTVSRPLELADTAYMVVSLEVWQSQMPPCFSKVSKISSLLANRSVDENANFSKK